MKNLGKRTEQILTATLLLLYIPFILYYELTGRDALHQINPYTDNNDRIPGPEMKSDD